MAYVCYYGEEVASSVSYIVREIITELEVSEICPSYILLILRKVIRMKEVNLQNTKNV